MLRRATGVPIQRTREAYDGLVKLTAHGPRWTGLGRFAADKLVEPLSWREPARVFVDSMSDLFFEEFTDDQIDQVLAVMLLAPRHTFQVLTKRPARMRSYLSGATLYERVLTAAGRFRDVFPQFNQIAIENPTTRPAPWIWWGVSVENQDAADERIPDLLETPAAVRFLSCEPLLGPLDLTGRLGLYANCPDCGLGVSLDEDGCCATCGLDAHHYGVDWVIAGCESGPGARPCDAAWLRSLRDQCASASVPFFLKQAQVNRDVGKWIVSAGHGSKHKAGGVIELPYLDGEQHAAFPEVAQ